MKLRTACDQGCNERRSDAAPHVAHEVRDSGYRVVFLDRNPDVCHQRNRHKQEAQADDLRNAQPYSRVKAHLQVDSPCGIEHCQRQRQPAESNQAARLNFRGQLTHEWRFYE
jgi:hypothetical protein